MSTVQDNGEQTRQTALDDDYDRDDCERTRAREHCFREFLDYYESASIRPGPTLAEQPDAWTVDSFSITRELGNGTRMNLVECPIDGCHAPFSPGDSPSEHILAEHGPEDVGLSPIQNAVEERTVCQRTESAPTDEDQATLSDW